MQDTDYPTRTAQILRAVGCKNLALYKEDGYFYFAYDDQQKNIFLTHSVYVGRLNSLSIGEWSKEAQTLLDEVQVMIEKAADKNPDIWKIKL